MKKGWFTMIETIIVLAIVSFLLGMTMYIWSERINKLNDMNTKQNFVAKYQELYMNSITSSYFNGQKYGSINIDIGSGWAYFAIDSWSRYPLIDAKTFSFTGISINSKNVNWFKIKMSPYQIKCLLSTGANQDVTIKKVDFRLKANNANNYRCFKISNYNCKIVEVRCG